MEALPSGGAVDRRRIGKNYGDRRDYELLAGRALALAFRGCDIATRCIGSVCAHAIIRITGRSVLRVRMRAAKGNAAHRTLRLTIYRVDVDADRRASLLPACHYSSSRVVTTPPSTISIFGDAINDPRPSRQSRSSKVAPFPQSHAPFVEQRERVYPAIRSH